MDLDFETFGLVALGLVILALIVKRIRRKRHAADVLEALKAFRCDAGAPESQFHRALKKHLERVLDRSLLQKVLIDAPLPRTKTEIDLHIEYGKVDYLVTVKKGISAQKTKTLAGEVQEIYKYWPRDTDRTVRVVIMLYGELEADAGDDHILKIMELAFDTNAKRTDMHLEFVFLPGANRARRRRTR